MPLRFVGSCFPLAWAGVRLALLPTNVEGFPKTSETWLIIAADGDRYVLKRPAHALPPNTSARTVSIIFWCEEAARTGQGARPGHSLFQRFSKRAAQTR